VTFDEAECDEDRSPESDAYGSDQLAARHHEDADQQVQTADCPEPPIGKRTGSHVHTIAPTAADVGRKHKRPGIPGLKCTPPDLNREPTD
jgi:hypothetical protein